tara:strand:- start:71 stop:394 length:324 start_codon:yes stop_codon:yes gene_type:complete
MGRGVKFWVIEVLKEIKEMFFSILKFPFLILGNILIYLIPFCFFWMLSVGSYFSWYSFEFGQSPNMTNLPFSFNIIIPVVLTIISGKYIKKLFKKVKDRFLSSIHKS